MTKFSGSFFDGEVLFVGFNEKEKWFCMQVHKALTRKGIAVYPVTSEGKDKFELPVFGSLDEAPKSPRCAYLITDKEVTAGLLEPLHARGIRKILFNSKNVADEAIVKKCESLGIEAAVACPLMAYGGGLHRFHGFIAGVKKA